MYALDIDWCLYCNQHIEGGDPYCSLHCRSKDQPLSPTLSSLHTLSSVGNDRNVVYHSQPTPSDRARILAWAANIPSGPPEGSSPKSSRSPSPQPIRTPQLLLNHRRPIAPTLCMSTPQPTCPKQSRPILTPQQSIASMNIASYTETATPGASVTSALTDSFVATPSSTGVTDPLSYQESFNSKPAAMFEVLATQVRSWVHPSQSYSNPRASHPAVCQQKPFSHCNTADDADCDAIWWAPEPRDSTMKRHSAEKFKSPRARTDSKGALRAPDHPAYRARGRKVSRPLP